MRQKRIASGKGAETGMACLLLDGGSLGLWMVWHGMEG